MGNQCCTEINENKNQLEHTEIKMEFINNKIDINLYNNQSTIDSNKPNEDLFENIENFLDKNNKQLCNLNAKPIDNLPILGPHLYKENDIIYQGQYKMGLKSGLGILKFNKKNIIYYGYFKEDKFSGFGRLTINNNISIEGEWLNNNLKNGDKILYKNLEENTSYNGKIKNDLQNGYGVEYYSKDNYYEGEFLDGLKNGEGKLVFNNSKSYEGEFKNDTIDGYGVMIYDEFKKYEGNFLNNQLNGFGKFTYTNGITYEGNFKNNLKHGIGKITYKNGDYFTTKFINGKIINKSNIVVFNKYSTINI